MADTNDFVSDAYFADPDEAILPDDFTPGDDNYDLEAGLHEEDAPVAEEPTTATPQAETDPVVPEAQVEPTEPTVTPEEPAPTEPAPQEEVVPPVPQTIKVKFNHEEREIGLDEAALLAQKGMNYDKLQQKLTEYESRLTKSDQLARQLGYQSSDEMLEAAGKNFVDKQVQELVDAGNTEAMARFLVEQQMAKAASALPKTEPKPEPAPEQTPTAPTPSPAVDPIPPERRAELMEFVKAYPGVTKLPDEVIKANKAGTRLLVAYERYQNKAALNELAILKQNQAAAEKAPVSGVAGKSASTQNHEEDPFIKGFDSDPW